MCTQYWRIQGQDAGSRPRLLAEAEQERALIETRAATCAAPACCMTLAPLRCAPVQAKQAEALKATLAAKRQRLQQAEADAAEAEGELQRLSIVVATAEQVGGPCFRASTCHANPLAMRTNLAPPWLPLPSKWGLAHGLHPGLPSPL